MEKINVNTSGGLRMKPKAFKQLKKSIDECRAISVKPMIKRQIKIYRLEKAVISEAIKSADYASHLCTDKKCGWDFCQLHKAVAALLKYRGGK